MYSGGLDSLLALLRANDVASFKGMGVEVSFMVQAPPQLSAQKNSIPVEKMGEASGQEPADLYTVNKNSIPVEKMGEASGQEPADLYTVNITHFDQILTWSSEGTDEMPLAGDLPLDQATPVDDPIAEHQSEDSQ